MSFIFRSILCAFFLISVLLVDAQEFGGNPPAVKWQQVNTPSARVIFPKGLDSVAKEIAGIVDLLSNRQERSALERQQKVNIVLQNQTTVSNAYVRLGPFRSEFFLTPLQNSFALGSLPWHEQLAIHEFRHVQQNNDFNVGLSRVFRILFGQDGQALANSLVIPDWFYEGDAVYNETNVSRQGRGRLPFFFNDYRSLWSAGKKYSWMKLRNGSLRDFIPDHYALGYLLVAYGNDKYGNSFWRDVTKDAASFKGLFYPLQKAVKKHAGKDYVSFRNDAIQYFKSRSAQTQTPKEGAENSRQHFIADEEFPAYINDSVLVFMKSSYNQIPAFTIRSGNQEKKLRVRDVSHDNHFSYRNGKIVYASYRPDLRWGWRNFSSVQLLDVGTGLQRSITTRTKYFSPDISEDGSTIVAVWADPNGKSALHFLDAGNGMVVTEVPNPSNLFYTYPKFFNLKQIVSAVRNGAGQMSLAMIDAAKGTTDYLVPFSNNVIGFPFIHGDTVYFSASHKEYDRLFAYVIPGKQLFILKHHAMEEITGNYQLAVTAKSIVWTHFTANGYQLKQVSKDQLEWVNITASAFAQPLSNFNISAVDGNLAQLTFSPGQMAASNYPKTFRLLNFHSLRPLISDPLYSLSIIGENILNTLQSELFFRYNRNERYNQFGFNAIYGAWFPYVTLGADYTINRRGRFNGQRIYWNELELRGGLSVPLNLSKGRNFRGLSFGADYVFNQPNFKGVFKDSVGNQSFSYVDGYISFYNQIQRARQHIYPRFAQSLFINYKKAVSNFEANQFLVSGNFYLPGAFVNHNLVVNMAFQQRDTLNEHRFSNNFPFSRGYVSENFYRMTKWGATYHFPLFYPDAGFGNLVYLLRARAGAFYDHSYVRDFLSNSQKFTLNFRSAGTEVFFDTKWWNQLPVTFGFRYSYLLDNDVFGGSGSHRFEFILPVNLIQ